MLALSVPILLFAVVIVFVAVVSSVLAVARLLLLAMTPFENVVVILATFALSAACAANCTL